MTTTRVDHRIKIEKPDEKRLADLGIKQWPIWTKEPSQFDWHYDSSEMCFFLEGSVIVKTDQGAVQIGQGDLVTFPQGLSCTWDVKVAVRKHYRFD